MAGGEEDGLTPNLKHAFSWHETLHLGGRSRSFVRAVLGSQPPLYGSHVIGYHRACFFFSTYMRLEDDLYSTSPAPLVQVPTTFTQCHHRRRFHPRASETASWNARLAFRRHLMQITAERGRMGWQRLSQSPPFTPAPLGAVCGREGAPIGPHRRAAARNRRWATRATNAGEHKTLDSTLGRGGELVVSRGVGGVAAPGRQAVAVPLHSHTTRDTPTATSGPPHHGVSRRPFAPLTQMAAPQTACDVPTDGRRRRQACPPPHHAAHGPCARPGGYTRATAHHPESPRRMHLQLMHARGGGGVSVPNPADVTTPPTSTRQPALPLSLTEGVST